MLYVAYHIYIILEASKISDFSEISKASAVFQENGFMSK